MKFISRCALCHFNNDRYRDACNVCKDFIDGTDMFVPEEVYNKIVNKIMNFMNDDDVE